MYSVREFYKDKTVFITGGSGFMGKVLIEKLLRSCSDLKQILVLMRPKRGKTGAERIEAFSNIPMFQKLLEKDPGALKKLVPVYGDISEENLGLSNDHMSLIVRETNVVMHFAATLNFEAPIKTAVKMNIKGLESVINLSKQMKNLNVIVHLSTAYCNTDQDVMTEKLYDFDMKPRQLMAILDGLSDEIVDTFEKKLILKTHPNTYTYTKRLGELMVAEEHKNLPICIVRPSIGEKFESELMIINYRNIAL
jgi:alcohol-forming fatty acyl-CoA reductase